MTKNYNNTGPLEKLLDRISEAELDSCRREKYNRLRAEAISRRKTRTRWLFVSLTAASIIIVIIVLTSIPGTIDSNELYQAYYAPHEFPVEYRGTDDFLEDFKESVNLYKDGKIDEARTNLDPLLASEENNPEYLLLMSQILMEQSKFDAAIIYLKKTIEFGGSFERTGLWYLALSYLATKKYDQCIEVLGLLSEPADSQFSKNATKLRKKVKRISNEQ